MCVYVCVYAAASSPATVSGRDSTVALTPAYTHTRTQIEREREREREGERGRDRQTERDRLHYIFKRVVYVYNCGIKALCMYNTEA